jgi:hypothetical protein
MDFLFSFHFTKFTMLKTSRILRTSLFLSLVAVSFSLWSCDQSGSPSSSQSGIPTSIAPATGKTDWSGQPQFIQNAIAVQGRHEAALMAIPGVIGDGVGMSHTTANTATILVFTSEYGVEGIPASLEGIATEVKMVGKVTAHSFTGSYRDPLPCGVSVGPNALLNNEYCVAGSIGALVNSTLTKSGTSTYGGAMTVYTNDYSWGSSTPVYMLSCNHVFANENNGTSHAQQDQPGRADQDCGTNGAVGALHSWNEIKSSRNTTNYYDAALAECNPNLTDGWSPAMMSNASTTPYTLSYTPANTTVAPSVGLGIKKTGRTTGYNTASIYGINVTITVGYQNFDAVFVDQIYVDNGTYIESGDSGSMSVVNSTGSNNNDPVGLDFAGSSTACFMNRMDHIANDFGLTFVQSGF